MKTLHRTEPEDGIVITEFRKPKFTPPVAEQAVAIDAHALWLQQSIVIEDAFRIASDTG